MRHVLAPMLMWTLVAATAGAQPAVDSAPAAASAASGAAASRRTVEVSVVAEGAAVPGAEVLLKEGQTGRKKTTDQEGRVTFSGLGQGAFDIRVIKAGWKTWHGQAKASETVVLAELKK